MTEPRLAGKRAVITGGTRGLGLAFAQDLLRHGARVVINGVDGDRCRAAEEHLEAHGPVASVVGSVADPAVVQRLVDTCTERFGGIDLLVNNAGVTRDRTLMKMSVAEFDEVIDVHLRGAWAASRSAASAMTGTGGAIVNIISGSALYGLVGQSNYAAAKGGMLGLTRALSLELRRHRIRVNALYPVALTDMTRPVVEQSGSDDTEAWFAPPERVAPVISFLASDSAEQINGQVLAFDGHELTMWTHPAPIPAGHHDRTWEAEDFAGALLTCSSPRPTVNPDRLGAHVHASLSPGQGQQ